MAAPSLGAWERLSQSNRYDYVQLLRSDFRRFAVDMLCVRPKEPDAVGKRNATLETPALIPFVFNEVQEDIYSNVLMRWEKQLPLEIRILKARQFGVSTFWCAFDFWQMWRMNNFASAVVAFRKDTTLAELNETMATFYDNLPVYARPELRAAGGKRVSKDELYFNDRRSSCMFVVQKESAMRGVARHGVLCTEVSHYKEPEEFFGGFLPALDRGPRRFLIMESSPADGFFRDKYMEAKEGSSRALALFYAWWYNRTLCALPLVTKKGKPYDARTGELVRFDRDERAEQAALSRLAAEIGRPPITDEQMYWRQVIIHDEFNDDEEYFNQEFPRDDVSAFERDSKSAFKAVLPTIRKTVWQSGFLDESKVGQLIARNLSDMQTVSVYFAREERRSYKSFDFSNRRDPDKGLTIFRDPNPEFHYTVGADVASDVGDDENVSERAFSCGSVYCCETHDQVAEWYGHIDPHDLGDELCKLGYYYNTALLCIERNNMGISTETRVKTYLNYPNRYRWPDFNVGPEKLTNKEMWETNSKTKPYMIGEFKNWVQTGLFRVHSPWLEEEMVNYLILKGLYKTRDRPSDRIIAASLAVLAAQQQYMHIVLASPHVEAQVKPQGFAHAAVQQGVQAVPRELPDEFYDAGFENLKVVDVWTAARL